MIFQIKFAGSRIDCQPEFAVALERIAQTFMAVQLHKPVEIAPGESGVHAGKIESRRIFDPVAERQCFPDQRAVQVNNRYQRAVIAGSFHIQQKMADVAIAVADVIVVHKRRRAGDFFQQRVFELECRRICLPLFADIFQRNIVAQLCCYQKRFPFCRIHAPFAVCFGSHRRHIQCCQSIDGGKLIARPQNRQFELKKIFENLFPAHAQMMFEEKAPAVQLQTQRAAGLDFPEKSSVKFADFCKGVAVLPQLPEKSA